MLKSCELAEIDHNIMALQPESSPHIISADGQCLMAGQKIRQLSTDNTLEELEVLIDASHLLGDQNQTLLGKNAPYLPCSIAFTLEDFEPRPDGTCLLRYRRKQ